MTRVKKGKTTHKKRKKILRETKGFKWGRNSKKRSAKEALLKAYSYAFVGRKQKKRSFRRLWNVRINALLRQLGTKYSTFIHELKQKNVEIDRKIMSEMAEKYPDLFKSFVLKINKMEIINSNSAKDEEEKTNKSSIKETPQNAEKSVS